MSETLLSSDVATTDEIRAHFPALLRRHAGRPVAYFDAPGGTQVPRVVAEAMSGYLLEHNANTHWAYPTSQETDAIIDAAREAVGELLNGSPGEIVFGANMTTLTYHLARTLGRTWSAGDEVIVTELDHHANVDPWRALERDFGIVIRTARMIPETAQLDLEHLSGLVSARTKLVAVGGASNAVGTINDLERVGSIARAAGALFFVDAVHLTPHELIDVRAIGCDFLGCSAYKFYGPHLGILYIRRQLLESLPFPKLAPSPDNAPERAETGTQNHEGIAAAGATVDFLASLAAGAGPRRQRLERVYAALHARGQQLTEMLWQGLSGIRGVRLYGPGPSQPRTPTVAFTLGGISSEEICRRLAGQAIFASHGGFYAMTALERLGLGDDGLVRIGCACYTSEEEIARLLEAVAALA
ncbi:MAG: cysteine desulfurase [Acidobacteria bacterium]|nr:cysteine desulfurase [Acidobacteriota bacterium]